MRTTLLAVAAVLGLALLPTPASAAASDDATQADAQRAADTRYTDRATATIASRCRSCNKTRFRYVFG